LEGHAAMYCHLVTLNVKIIKQTPSHLGNNDLGC